jgi:serine kinase of HPr protein (carbohydrate metabolism regulator)
MSLEPVPPADAEPRTGPGRRGSRGLEYIHASAVAIKETGVLIRGPSGAGKSRLALALIGAAEAAGIFSRLIGDDRICLERRGGRIIARPHPKILGQIEQRGRGILEIPFLTAAVVRLAIDLEPLGELPPRYPEPGSDRMEFAGIGLPLLRLRQDAPASDLALTVLQVFNLRSKSL